VARVAKATGGSTTRNIAETRLTEIGGQPTSLVAETAQAVAIVQVALGERAVRVASAEPVGQVVLVVPVAQVASAGLVGQVALAEPVAQVASAGPGAQVVPELVPERQRAQVALPAKAKSAIAAHHRGLVLVRAVEDLAAVAETTRERAAAEVAAAWAVAVTVAAVAVE
jgi:hypothetical protein